MFRVEADLLIFGYGYISPGDLISDLIEYTVEWLKNSPTRSVEIYVGILADPSVPFSGDYKAWKIGTILADFEKILKTDLYASGVTDRISVKAILGFHCKFALASRLDNERGMTPVAGLFGSSNLSYSALAGDNRYELDLFIGEDDALLGEFSRSIGEIISEADQSPGLEEVGEAIEERIFYQQAIQEAENDILTAELHDRHSYKGHSKEERQALMESDEDQGIYAIWPTKKK